jgi:hypothetical protein
LSNYARVLGRIVLRSRWPHVEAIGVWRLLHTWNVAALLIGGGHLKPVYAQGGARTTLRPANASHAGELTFASVTSIRELPDGSLLVADRANKRILHLRWDGSEPRQVGRLGDGPGEYRHPGWLYSMGGDSTLFTDEYSGRWIVLRHNRILSTVSEGGALTRLLGGELAGAGRGKVLGLADWSRRARSDSLSVVLVDLVAGRGDTIARLKARGSVPRFTMLPPTASRRNPGVIFGNPLETEEQALFFHDGWVAIARLDPYRVDWRSPDGSWTLGAPLPFERRPVDRAERCWAVERLVQEGVCPEDMSGWPAFVPPFVPRGPNNALLPLLAAPDGRLVIARRASRTAPESRYDIVDRGGRLSGVLVLADNEALLGFGRGSIYVLSADGDGVGTVRRHAWP